MSEESDKKEKYLFEYVNVGFNFQYTNDEGKRTTTLVTTNTVNGEVAKYSVTCHFKDRFEKAVGRHKAFEKLLATIPSKRARKELWELYYSKCKK
jgi:hypothetical protein